MRITRRSAMTLIGGAIALPIMPALAQTKLLDDPFPTLSAKRSTLEDLPDRVLPSGRLRPVGTAMADDDEYEVTHALIEAAPFDCSPVEVAMYWRNIGQGIMPELGSDRLNSLVHPEFARGWPLKANPVILSFFQGTRTNPMALQGDGTPWCAAFVNWCIARGHSKTSSSGVGAKKKLGIFGREALDRGTRSASSGSFRCWDVETTDPKYGDVCVWALKGTINNCAKDVRIEGTGHVGFWAGVQDSGRIHLLGGNQRLKTGSKQFVVNLRGFGKIFPRDGNDFELITYRQERI